MTRRTFAFWVRFALTAVVVTFPVAYAVAAGALAPVYAVGYAAAAGIAVLAVWDGTRNDSGPVPRVRVEPDAGDARSPASFQEDLCAA